MFMLSRLSLDVGQGNFWWPLMLQGASLGLIFVPLTTVTNDPIPRERLGNAASLFNLMRNIGASVGISMVETLQVRRTQVHINQLGGNVTAASLQAQRMMAGMRGHFITQGADSITASKQAYGTVWGMLQQQASMLAYNDVFFYLAILFVVMFPLIFLMKRPQRGKVAMGH